ncbi:MAG: aspartate dehydrogenase [Rhodospirillaceae bacterium]|nr:aspartate dehydrogenase [Rhodospirillaceae bacterium]
MTSSAQSSIAIVGYGAIGRYTVGAMTGDAGCRIVAVIVRPARVAETQAALGPAIQVTDRIASLAESPGLIVEAAGHGALGEHGVPALRAGRRLLVVSVGALADWALLAELERAANEGGGTAEIAPGAIGGIDALAAARQGGLERVAYTSRKPPAAWKGTPGEALCDLDRLDAPFTLFEGPADEAARTYPKNANVAATVALAGAGFDKTEVRIVADPDAPGNVHEIEAIGAFGRMALRMEGKPLPDNPKTSSLTAFSVLRAIRNEAAAIRI